MILSPKEFLDKKPMYIINTSNLKETIVKNKTNIKINIEFTESVPINTLCYVILLGEKKLKYDITHERIRERKKFQEWFFLIF